MGENSQNEQNAGILETSEEEMLRLLRSCWIIRVYRLPARRQNLNGCANHSRKMG